VALLYIASAWAGLSLAGSVSHSITAVWMPSGIALAAVMFWGYRMLPFVFCGALAINLLVGEATPVAAGMIAVGNTSEALIAVVLLSRLNGVPHGRAPNLRDLAVAAAAGCAVAASVGTLALKVTSALEPGEWLSGWVLWWIGDFAGVFLVVPLVLLLATVDWDHSSGDTWT
jgi:integral membrane sensor domain MASE1